MKGEPKMRDLTKEFLDKAQEHVNRTGKLPPLVSPETARKIRSEADAKITEMAAKVHSIIHNEGREPYPEELELLERIKNSTHTHWLDTSFWGVHRMIWDARLKHFQGLPPGERRRIARTTSRYSYHACEITDVYISDVDGNALQTTQAVHPTWDENTSKYNDDGKHPWEVAWEWMQENGFTHYFHRGVLRTNYGDTPYAWMDLKTVTKEIEKHREWQQQE